MLHACCLEHLSGGHSHVAHNLAFVVPKLHLYVQNRNAPRIYDVLVDADLIFKTRETLAKAGQINVPGVKFSHRLLEVGSESVNPFALLVQILPGSSLKRVAPDEP